MLTGFLSTLNECIFFLSVGILYGCIQLLSLTDTHLKYKCTPLVFLAELLLAFFKITINVI